MVVFILEEIMKFCIHDWKRTEEPKHSRFSYDGMEILIAMCACKKCGKKKVRKFAGKYVEQLFD